MAEPFIEDFLVYPQMIALAACLCAEIAKSGLPTPCFCGVIEGTEANLDCGTCEDGCGAAWVRLDSAVPTRDFPNPDTSAAKCGSQIAFSIEVGITRCFSPFSDERGNGQGVAEHLDVTRTQLADMAAMKRAIACCFADKDTDYVLGSYSPITFLGGCGGGSWQIVVAGAI